MNQILISTKIVWFLLINFFIIVYGISSSLEGKHNALYTNNLLSGDLIIPRKVDHTGQHLSHNLTHFHDDETDQLHYHIPIGNETVHIELEPSITFISPHMVIERHRRDLKTRKKPNQQNCHYQGRIRGHENSKVALSACNGLAGYVRTNKGDYWIEPSKNQLKSLEKGHPHIIFQKSDIKNHQNDINNSKKKKKKHKKRTSNCSTKEPKGPTETHIEWQPQGKVIVQGGRKTRRHNNPSHINNNNNNNKNKTKRTRIKRSISRPRHVETLLVADSTMVQFHQDSDIEMYLLAIMNLVSSLYKDPTIGNLIHIVVVKMILLEDDESQEDLNITHVAENNLSNFCRWQKNLNPKDEIDPHHHDVAILITRNNICSKNGCQTLGVANVGGMCHPDRSCSVNEDNGITLAHTIAHELGHNFGMLHDTDKIGCSGRSGPIVHVMTPSFEADALHVLWSNCSRRDITQFLDQGNGKCLDDEPSQQDFAYPDLPPGAIYNADLQCRLQFNSTDESIKVCSRLDEICSQLWCLVDNNCITLLRPAAAGTKCGRQSWCQNKECVPVEELPTPIDGGWGNWSEYSECSRTCGGGVSVQTRQCDNPKPEHGGAFCTGERSRYKICNIDLCPENDPSYRAIQCSKRNNEKFRGATYKWLPYFDSQEPCEIFCTDTDDTVIVPFGQVADGTPCNIGTRDMCISGICRKVGCDWTVDSNTTEDQCGVCGGNGSTCVTIKREFHKKVSTTDAYFEITTIPAGSRHIIIEEITPSKNFISISKANSEKFLLNGNHLVSLPGEMRISGSIALYSREKELENLKIPGPINEDISLYVLFRNKHKLVNLRYEYTLSSNSTEIPSYEWKLGDWTACTRTCGGGIQNRSPICVQVNFGITDEENCWNEAINDRPDEKVRVCNEDPCKAHWWVGPWQLCPITCKIPGLSDPVRKRSIMCVDINELALPDSHCEKLQKPEDTQPCGTILPECDYEYDENLTYK